MRGGILAHDPQKFAYIIYLLGAGFIAAGVVAYLATGLFLLAVATVLVGFMLFAIPHDHKKKI